MDELRYYLMTKPRPAAAVKEKSDVEKDLERRIRRRRR